MTLVEVLVMVAILAASGLVMATLFTNQRKAVSYLEFTTKREQMRLALLGQVLNEPNNCRCLFQGASDFMPTTPVNLSGYKKPDQLGAFPNKNNCLGTMPNPLVSESGIDSIKLTDLSLEGITVTGSSLTGLFHVKLQSQKEVGGPDVTELKIPVAVHAQYKPSGLFEFRGCSMAAAGGGPQLQDVLRSAEQFTMSACLRDKSNTLHSLVSPCPLNYQLLSCAGGPGDQEESDEGFWIVPDFKANTCTLQVTQPMCSPGQPWTQQRSIAVCYPVSP
nr:hypothetical protein [uncultured organism]